MKEKAVSVMLMDQEMKELTKEEIYAREQLEGSTSYLIFLRRPCHLKRTEPTKATLALLLLFRVGFPPEYVVQFLCALSYRQEQGPAPCNIASSFSRVREFSLILGSYC